MNLQLNSYQFSYQAYLHFALTLCLPTTAKSCLNKKVKRYNYATPPFGKHSSDSFSRTLGLQLLCAKSLCSKHYTFLTPLFVGPLVSPLSSKELSCRDIVNRVLSEINKYLPAIFRLLNSYSGCRKLRKKKKIWLCKLSRKRS